MVKRWRMCRKCRVKMLLQISEEEVSMYVCPICKDGEMDLQGKLLKEIKELSENTGKSIQDLIIEALEKYGE